MRNETKLYQFCIKADNVHEFNDQMKAFCQSRKVIRITPFPDFLAYIDYEETETILESRLELFESIESHKCGDCPLLIKPADGRRKKLTCSRTGKMKYETSPACEEFYMKGGFDEKYLSESCECDEIKKLVGF